MIFSCLWYTLFTCRQLILLSVATFSSLTMLRSPFSLSLMRCPLLLPKSN
uniref:Uncharacterized protein n=1 Tax=Arundo donax TaxID=35708 RepID=A0A0A9A9A3_ARUDO